MPVDSSFLLRAARVSAWTLGGALLFAAFGKALDSTQFAREVESILLSFGFGGSAALVRFSGVAAGLLVMLELVIGAMLIVGWQRRLAAVATMTLMAFFIGVIGWGMHLGVLEECSCFGDLATRSPLMAVVEDAVLLALAGVVCFPAQDKGQNRKSIMLAIVTAEVVCMIAFTVLPTKWGVLKAGDSFPEMSAVPPLEFPAMSMLWNLNSECTDCVGKTPVLNYISESMPVQAFTDASEGRVREYQWDYQPRFPVSQVRTETIERLGLPLGCVLLLRGKKVAQIFRIFELDGTLSEEISQIKSEKP